MTFQHYDLALAEAAQIERFWQDPEEFDGYEYVPMDDEQFEELIDEYFEFINEQQCVPIHL